MNNGSKSSARFRTKYTGKGQTKNYTVNFFLNYYSSELITNSRIWPELIELANVAIKNGNLTKNPGNVVFTHKVYYY
jgi:hypothetical protein